MSYSTSQLSTKYGFENPFKPDPLAIKALHYLNDGKRLLDVGCGEGADSVFFARQGFQVTSIDNNKDYLGRLRAYVKDNRLINISVRNGNVIRYHYSQNFYDVINCLLVGCCMRRSDFEYLLHCLKRTVKPAGIIIMSLRNYLDPEFTDYISTEAMIEPNTFRKKEDCCKIRYYIEKNRLREVFSDFEVLYYYEGLAPDKYEEVLQHGDSYIICRRIH
ncbi:methyltransferase domain-containing protein [Chitinophagaceae bacterium LB-8]|uniref:Methyltransferase domain-containing protein n=1 Tax=Paraflavisolibacter caeni TaxID=2982496 RepID=A0A9X2XXC3_9BACT|nr:class I SAM-dependent methyltransferase [Paraflavisolibacter caeni]MCU7550486.1 methyltransferase domain-containing protein [Paraflavisolibacter caeni]